MLRLQARESSLPLWQAAQECIRQNKLPARALGAVQNFAATPGDTENVLTFDAVAGATSYDISWGTETGVSPGNLGTELGSPKTH